MSDFNIRKSDKKKQIVYGEVYIPDIPDSDGEFMNREEIEKMAHGFMANQKTHKIDIQHDNKEYGLYAVESFIARKGDETFIEGSWVLGVHIPYADIWELVEKGELNGFSLEALVSKKQVEIELTLPVLLTGITEESDGHVHHYSVFIDEDGNFSGGSTNEVEGHSHTISRGTATDKTNGHSHRYSFVEYLLELEGNEEED